jgi:hypothetical protein
MKSGKDSGDYDAEIAAIVKIADQHNVRTPLVISMPPDNPLSTPIIKWVASLADDDLNANT